MLLIAGYMATGHFLTKSNNQTIYELKTNDDCTINVGGHCTLKSGDLVIELKVKADNIVIQSSHDLVKVNIGLDDQTMLMQKVQSAKHWIVKSNMRNRPLTRIRYVAQSEAGVFIAEISQ